MSIKLTGRRSTMLLGNTFFLDLITNADDIVEYRFWPRQGARLCSPNLQVGIFMIAPGTFHCMNPLTATPLLP